MQLDDHLAACRLVQPVDVLRDDAREDARRLQVGQRLVRRVGLRRAEGIDHLDLALPPFGRILVEGLDVRSLRIAY